MRLFLAIDIDAGTRGQLEAVRASVEAAAQSARTPPRISWVRPEVAHLTVRFLGELDSHFVQAVQEALATLVIEPFDVTWGTAGVFGSARNPRVLFLTPVQGTDALRSVVAGVDERLDPVLGEGRDHAFKAHLTIGRVREAGRGVDWRATMEAVQVSPTVTRVADVTLYQSRLSPKGPTYTALSSHG